LLAVYRTPANQRTDVETNPDIYNQTTPSEMGSLLADLYDCAENNSGALLAAFPGEITQAGCQQMLDILARDKIGVLIEAGVPEGTRVAHKHGWISGPNGVIQNVSDAGVVYTPGGNYVLSIYTYHPREAIWQQVSTLIARISQVVYNYYNLPTQ
jgi:beta-lactamase class A